jgi:hypothetical protein
MMKRNQIVSLIKQIKSSPKELTETKKILENNSIVRDKK